MIQGWAHIAILLCGFIIAGIFIWHFGATLAFWAGIVSVVSVILACFAFIVLETQA